MDAGECGWVRMSVTFFGWVWVGVGECDLLMAGYGWVWLSVTFFWLGVVGCGWVWVSLEE